MHSIQNCQAQISDGLLSSRWHAANSAAPANSMLDMRRLPTCMFAFIITRDGLRTHTLTRANVSGAEPIATALVLVAREAEGAQGHSPYKS